MMYRVIEIIVVCLCLLCSLSYFSKMRKSHDASSSREEIINYFKEQKAFSVETGIKIKDLPDHIARDENLIMMAGDRTLKFKKGKYFLNVKQ